MLLRSFLAVVQERGFSRAARQLNLRQSTLSQHVARLEEAVGRRLFARSTRELALTPAGETLVEYARTILATYERAQRSLQRSTLRGRVRLGASEEFAIERLAPILSEFRRVHREIDLGVTIATAVAIEAMYAAGELDLMIVERSGKGAPGSDLRHETVSWFAAPGYAIAPGEPVPVVLPAGEHVIRKVAVAALEASGRAWRETCTAESYLGLRAAAMAGLGVTALSSLALPLSLERVRPECDLPELPGIRLVLESTGASPAAHELEQSIRNSNQ